VIQGLNITELSSCELHASFDLNGPIGPYTVYVENLSGLFAELKDGFTVLKPVTNCTDVFHTDTLGSGHVPGTIVQQLDSAFLVKGPYAGMILATQQLPAGMSMAAVDIDTINPPDPIQFPGALGLIKDGPPLSLDVDESTGSIFVAWTDKPDTVQVYDPATGNSAGSVKLGSDANILGLDTDGLGGFWVVFSDSDPAPHVRHYFSDSGTGLFALVPEQSFDLLPVYAAIQDIVVLPDFRMYVFCTPDKGTILSYDISGLKPALLATAGNVFPSALMPTSAGKSGDIEIDQTDPSSASCRIVAFANLQSGGSMAIKLDANLNTLANIPIAMRYQTLSINPDPDPLNRAIVLYSKDKSPSEYRLLQAPIGW
jgi:hypothetical protein